MGHLVGTAHRGLGTARRVSTRHIPHVVTDVPDGDLAPTCVALTTSIRQAWSPLTAADEVTASWARCTALEAARGYTIETVTHGWDLAVATGQRSDAPAGIADRCLTYAASVIPDRLRGVMYLTPTALGPSTAVVVKAPCGRRGRGGRRSPDGWSSR